MSAGTCEGDPFADPRGLMCVAQADGRRTLGRNPAHQQMDDRGGEENCRAAANKLRKIRRAPVERIPPTPTREHATPRSNASFETKHPPPAAFQELPSWLQRVARRTLSSENKIVRSGASRPRRRRFQPGM